MGQALLRVRSMTDMLLREIDEEVRKDRLEQLWKRHGRAFLVLALVLVLAATGYTLWQNRRLAAQERETAVLASLLQDSTPEKAAETQKKLAEFAAGASPGQAALARLYASSWVGDAAQRTEALAQLEAISQAPGTPAPYRDLATLLAVQLQVDDGDIAALQNRLAPLRAEGAPWRYAARELSALLFLRAGEVESARATLEALKADSGAPAGVKDRAGKLLATL